MSSELTVERLLDVTPEQAYDAYLDPEAAKVWFTILDPGMIVEIDADVRVGGEWSATWGFSPDEMFWEKQTLLVLDRPNRIVATSAGGSPDGSELVTEVTVTFEAHDGKTLMKVHQTGFPDDATRDFFSDQAWNGFFERFAAYLDSIR
jgi:uncharacterized protein YndB with AHSA1/START domain